MITNVAVETRHALSLRQTIKQSDKNDGKNTISSIVGGYKSAVTKHVRRLGYQFAWQSRFHDYIIRNDLEYDRIVKYIQNNPQNWHRDKFCDS